MRLHISADGACWGNPGPAAIGAIIKDENQKKLIEISEYIGHGTNNQAEYRSLIAALKSALQLNADEIVLNLDSELVMKQLTGEYRVKNASLYPLYLEAAELLKKFKNLSMNHVGHTGNDEAHDLAKSALKNQMKTHGSSLTPH